MPGRARSRRARRASKSTEGARRAAGRARGEALAPGEAGRIEPLSAVATLIPMSPKMRVTEVPLIDRLFLLGPPGVGKTERIKQLAMEEARREGRVFVDVREAASRQELFEDIVRNPGKYYVYLRIAAPHLFPEDVQYPAMRRGYVEYLPPKALYLLSLPGIKGTIFVDELTNIERMDQLTLYYTLFLEKEFGMTGRLSEGVKVVGAGNPPEYGGATEFTAPLLNRLWVVEVEPPTVEEWIDYMNRVEKETGRKWAREIGAFLAWAVKNGHPEAFMATDVESHTLKAFPTPRAWSQLAWMAAEDPRIAARLAPGKVGGKAAALLKEFLENQVPNVEEILEKPEKLAGLTLEGRYLAVGAIARRVDLLLKNPEKARRLVKWMMDNMGEYVALLLRLIGDVDDKVELLKVVPELMDYAMEVGEYALGG